MRITITLFAALLALTLLATPAHADDTKPIKVFLLAGQSNMVGHGRFEIGNGDTNANPTGAIGSLRYLVNNDPDKYGKLVDQNGDWVVRDDVWVWHNNDGGEKGKLTVGFGASTINIGPEYGFGWQVGDAFDEQVLIVKVAWGGKSLGKDFLPPSAADYPEPQQPGDTGYYYKQMIDTYKNVVANLQTHFPDYAGQDVELAGFGWFQGYNDRFDQGFANNYKDNLASFIKDVRKDLEAPDLPFVVASTGNGGNALSNANALKVIEGQQGVTDFEALPEFEGNVAFVETRPFWREPGVSPTGAGHHWNANGESYYLVGEGMGDAMVELVPEPGSALLLGGAGLLLARRGSR